MRMHLLAITLAALLALGAQGQKKFPVSKVITLLKDMKVQLEKEAEEDEDTYDKMACWCTTNDKEKSQAILDAEARITDLTSMIEQMTAQSAKLNTEIDGLKDEFAKNQKSLDVATSLREKQAGEFNGEEKDMLESIKALEAAIVVLSKHHPQTLLLAGADDAVASAVKAVQSQLKAHKGLFAGAITSRQRRLILGLMQQDAPAYSPASGEIFGILRQMKETFEANLSDSQKEEQANQKSFAELKLAKEDEINAGKAAIEQKTQQLATTDEKLATSKEDMEDTENSLSADQKFLMDLKERCQMNDKEWEERQKTRNTELTAIAEAITILTSDEAHDTFSKTFNPALVQRSAYSGRVARARASLLTSASRLHSPRLAALASNVQLDAFTKVKEAIDQMVAELMQENADEIKHRDFCIDELNQNEKTTQKKVMEKAGLEATLGDLKMTVQELSSAIETLKAEVSELQKQLKRAGEDRDLEHKDFQATVADQVETQRLLNKALAVLKGVYAKKGLALAQVEVDSLQEPPPTGFKTYEKKQTGGVIGLLEQIIADAKRMQAEAEEAETQAQAGYESFVQETNNSIAEKGKAIINKTEDIAKADQEITSSQTDLDGLNNVLETLDNDKLGLHKSCDFVLKNFDVRQEARAEEIEALKQAKAILSGMQTDGI